ncbi:hypothetical protein [Rhabdonatronobacter sediminivivens]|uniref:hypothetical protein n=1 Tax=Rhabdonatronobacter sediminivivens TaxID=2743469 RepID=UPI0015CF9A29|nr:hypothetical protein [Rhabdonatronobacter sediminivivens]
MDNPGPGHLVSPAADAVRAPKVLAGSSQGQSCAWGRAFIAVYWRIGPKMAVPVRSNRGLALAFKALIAGIVRILRKFWTI